MPAPENIPLEVGGAVGNSPAPRICSAQTAPAEGQGVGGSSRAHPEHGPGTPCLGNQWPKPAGLDSTEKWEMAGEMAR